MNGNKQENERKLVVIGQTNKNVYEWKVTINNKKDSSLMMYVQCIFTVRGTQSKAEGKKELSH